MGGGEVNASLPICAAASQGGLVRVVRGDARHGAAKRGATGAAFHSRRELQDGRRIVGAVLIGGVFVHVASKNVR